MVTKSKRYIRMEDLVPDHRQVLAGAAKTTCWKCRGEGIHSYHSYIDGTKALVCKCAWDAYIVATTYLAEENRRRGQGLPARLSRLINGILETGTQKGGYKIEAENPGYSEDLVDTKTTVL